MSHRSVKKQFNTLSWPSFATKRKCLDFPPGHRGAWWAAVHGVTKSQTRLSDFTFTFHFHALEKEMATHSSVLAWRMPGTGEPGGLPSMGSHRVRHDWSDLAAVSAHGKSQRVLPRPRSHTPSLHSGNTRVKATLSGTWNEEDKSNSKFLEDSFFLRSSTFKTLFIFLGGVLCVCVFCCAFAQALHMLCTHFSLVATSRPTL